MAFKFTPVDPDEYARGLEEEEEARSQEEALAAALAVEPHANLERFRKKRGFTKTEMAEMMDITPRSYYAYESGKRSIPTEALFRSVRPRQCDLPACQARFSSATSR